MAQPREQQKSEPLLKTADPNMLTPWRLKVRLYSAFQIVVSLIFWVWSVVNTVKGSFDLGAISFLFPLAAGICGIMSTAQRQTKTTYCNLHFGLTVFGHAFVAINYALGAVLTANSDNHVFFWYCVVFTVLWVLFGLLFSFWANQWRQEFKRFLQTKA